MEVDKNKLQDFLIDLHDALVWSEVELILIEKKLMELVKELKKLKDVIREIDRTDKAVCKALMRVSKGRL